MEYFYGVVSTLVSLIIFMKITKNARGSKINKIKYSQSRTFSIAGKNKYAFFKEYKQLETQATEHSKKNRLVILTIENNAYFINPNGLHVVDVSSGDFDKDSAKLVDTMGLNDVELEEISFIVEKLAQEGASNDYRSPGNEDIF